MANECLDLCLANAPLATRAEVTGTVGLWLIKFGKIPDELFYEAIMDCLETCTMFPTVAEIRVSIQRLYHKEQKPKEIEYQVKRGEPIAAKAAEAMRMSEDGQAKQFLQEVDIVNLMKYAKRTFPDITEDKVRKNLNEFIDGIKSHNMCFACRTDKNACLTGGWVVKHTVDKFGYVVNEMVKCPKTRK